MVSKEQSTRKYQSEVSTERQSQYLDFLIGPSLLFVLSLENEDDRKVHKGYSLPKVEIKCYNVMIDEKIFFDQPVKSGMKIYEKRLQQVKEMIKQLVFCFIIIISMSTIK